MLSSCDRKKRFKWRLCTNLILGRRYSFLSLSFSQDSYFAFVKAVQVGTYRGSNALLACFVDKEMVSSAYFHSFIYQAPQNLNCLLLIIFPLKIVKEGVISCTWRRLEHQPRISTTTEQQEIDLGRWRILIQIFRQIDWNDEAMTWKINRRITKIVKPMTKITKTMHQSIVLTVNCKFEHLNFNTRGPEIPWLVFPFTYSGLKIESFNILNLRIAIQH